MRRQRIETYLTTVDRNEYIPVAPHPKQRRFLLLSDAREVLYGGAARGGKTLAALMAAAQYVKVPGYSALLLRENFPDLMQPGAFIPLSKEWWYGRVGWNEQQRRWTFPGGATITFGYLERDDDVYQYQGSQFQTIIVDELTHHTEWRYRYLFSRLSRPDAGPLSQVPLRMRATANPGGKGHEWVKKRFISPQTREPAAVFIPARVADNPSVDQAAYVGSLSYLDPLTRAQLLAGDWDAVPGGRFDASWFRYFMRRGDYMVFDEKRIFHLYNQCRIFLTVDPAASEKNTADYTVISAWCATPDHDLCWLGCHRGQWEIPDIVPQIQSQYRRWRARVAGIEAVAANAAVYQFARRTAMVVTKVSPESRDKLVRATPAMSLAKDGRIWLPAPEADPTFPLEDVLAEVTRFTGDGDQDAHDDIVDTLSYAVELIDRLPTAQDRRQGPMVLGG